MTMRVRLTHDFALESAHFLPRVPEGHRCRRMHGHTFDVAVTIEGEVDAQSGWLVDYADIERAFAGVRTALDHRLLNEVPGLENPTSERLCAWLWERLAPALPGMTAITVHETCTARCTYRGA